MNSLNRRYINIFKGGNSMRFKDIKPFTQIGSWECDYELVQFEQQITKWEREMGLEMNPDFQRGHVWNERQQIRYMEFLLRGGKTARTIYLNRPGWQAEEPLIYKEFVCVDGLQRSTAIIRFVRNEIPVFNAYFFQYEDRPRLSQGVKININELPTKEAVLNWYIEFNTGGTIHTESEIDRVQRLLLAERTKKK